MTSSALHKIAEAINNAEEHVLAPDELELAKFDRSDLGNAKRLVARFGRDLIFVDGIGWHRWDGQRWQSEGGESAALTVAHKTAIAIKDEAAALRDAYKDGTLKLDTDTDSGEKKKSTPWDAHLKFSVASGNINRSTGMLRQALPYKRKMAGDLDRGHLYFNVQNGTLELPSIAGSGDANLRIHHREDFISHLSPVSFDRAAVAPTFDAFIQRILPHDEVRLFVQRWFGYCLTGITSEQQLALFHGQGANGKSTLVDTIAYVMGDYAKSLPIESLMLNKQKSGREASPDLARLPGARFVMTSEPEGNSRLSESFVKQVTGGERILVRGLNKDPFEFSPEFKLTVSFNIKPRIQGQDEGIWRRILLVPFNEFIPKEERDKSLIDKLRAEASGILNWMVDGYLEWLEKGLAAPEAVQKATDEYRTESDPIGEFIRTCIRHVKGQNVQASKLYDAYCRYARGNGHEPVKSAYFGRRISDRGYAKDKMGGLIMYLDIDIDESEIPQDNSGGSDDWRGDYR